MSSSVPDHDARTQPNTLRARLDAIRPGSVKARIDPNSDQQKEILAVIKRTKSELQLSGKEMALSAGCAESELSDALNGKDNRRFDAEWLWRQSDMFLLKFIENLMEERKLTPEHAKEVRRRRIVELVDLLTKELCA